LAPPRKHPTDEILDAARAIVLARGPRAASVKAIAAASGAPVGTLYHRFGSRDGLLVEVWVRALQRFQAIALAAADADAAALDRAVAMARAAVDFAERHPGDARLLLAVRREDLLDADPTDALRRRLTAMNAPLIDAVTAITRELHGQAVARALAAVTRAVVDLPYAAVRRYAGVTRLPPWLAGDVARDARALLQAASAIGPASGSH
jgi:AcrR family transcriptional regulator